MAPILRPSVLAPAESSKLRLYLSELYNATYRGIDADGKIVAAYGVSTAKANVDVTTPGAVAAWCHPAYELHRPIGKSRMFTIHVRVRWEVVIASAGACTGYVTVSVRKGSSTGTVLITRNSTPARSLAAPAAFTEVIEIPLTALTRFTFDADDWIYFSINPGIAMVSGTGGDTADLTLHHDPATAANQLIVEIDE